MLVMRVRVRVGLRPVQLGRRAAVAPGRGHNERCVAHAAWLAPITAWRGSGRLPWSPPPASLTILVTRPDHPSIHAVLACMA